MIRRDLYERVLDICAARGLTLEQLRAQNSDKARVTGQSIRTILRQESLHPAVINDFLSADQANTISILPSKRSDRKAYDIQGVMQEEIYGADRRRKM